jgi:hypothetical protein
MNYQKIYDQLIDRGKSRVLENCYFETHHIVPRCMGGNDEKENLIDLLPEEHFIVHLLLVKIYPDESKLIYAANMMSNFKKYTNKQYGWLKKKFIYFLSVNNSGENCHWFGKDHSGPNNPMFGRSVYSVWLDKYGKEEANKLLEEKSKNQSKSHLGENHFLNKMSFEEKEEWLNKHRRGENSPLFNKEFSEEHCNNISKTRIEKGIARGENNGMYGKGYLVSGIRNGRFNKPTSEKTKNIIRERIKNLDKLECPKCYKKMSIANYTRWGHGENCKQILSKNL